MPQAIADFVRDGDVVITMGAGSIGTVPQKLRDLLAGAVSASAAAQAPVPGGRA
jgi:UDP-N-acetylmuramate--alanine ligase